MREASVAQRSKAYAADLARSAQRLMFKRVRRNAGVVNEEYNVGHWGRVLSARDWEKCDLDAFLIGSNRRERLAKVDGRIVAIGTDDYYRYRLKALSSLLARHAGDSESLLELGAGFGYNLFSLSFDRRWRSLRGLDVAPNGIEAGRAIARHYGLSDRISFDRIDLTDSADTGFREIAGQTAFTFFCIEQIPYAVEAVIENILAARPRRVINIEPAAEMLSLTKPRDVVSFVYLKSVDYQNRLFTVLDGLEKAGRIRIVARERMRFAPTIRNDGQLYAWEPLITQ
ncbi:MAG: class I SAM-dependent methyltransferase [Hyphomicrobiaceae bacterium]